MTSRARQERNQARRTALNVALREQVAAYSAVEEDFRVLIMAMGSLMEAKMDNIADIAMEKMGTFNELYSYLRGKYGENHMFNR